MIDSTKVRGEASPRIASLVPSLTELLCALGLGPYLVARTGFCIHPFEEIQHIPKVGGTKDVNVAKLRRLEPTHVLVNVDENRREIVDAVAAWGGPVAPKLVVTHPCDPQDNLVLLQQMRAEFGHLPGVNERADELARALAQELAATLATRWPARRVLYLIWREPWMTVARDIYLSRMLGRIHWQTLPDLDGGAHGAARYPVVRGAETWLLDVQLVLLSSEPYAFGPPDIAAARALCRNAEVRQVDGELLSWYGARAVAGLRYLRELAGPPLRRLVSDGCDHPSGED